MTNHGLFRVISATPESVLTPCRNRAAGIAWREADGRAATDAAAAIGAGPTRLSKHCDVARRLASDPPEACAKQMNGDYRVTGGHDDV